LTKSVVPKLLLYALEDLDDAHRGVGVCTVAQAMALVELYGREYVEAARAVGSPL
jgi:hypothetical protein